MRGRRQSRFAISLPIACSGQFENLYGGHVGRRAGGELYTYSVGRFFQLDELKQIS